MVRRVLKVFPGLAFCFALLLFSLLFVEGTGILLHLTGFLPAESANPLSPIFVTVIAGMILRNTIGLSPLFLTGTQFALRTLLKIGIMLLGIRLSFFDVLTLGAWGIPVVVVCISVALAFTMRITRSLNQSQRLGILTATGTGICGITAIMSTAPSIQAKEEEVSYAIANITIFGITCMFLYPFLAHTLFPDEPIRAGLFLGTAIHDTAQVIGSSLIYEGQFQSETVVDVATVTKLTRNLFLVAVIPLMTVLYKRIEPGVSDEKKPAKAWYQLIPYFILGFVLMAGVRTIGDAGLSNGGNAFGLFPGPAWERIWKTTSTIGSTYFLGMAMAAVGLSTNLTLFRKLGVKPFLIGLCSALAVALTSLLMIYLLGGFIL